MLNYNFLSISDSSSILWYNPLDYNLYEFMIDIKYHLFQISCQYQKMYYASI